MLFHKLLNPSMTLNAIFCRASGSFLKTKFSVMPDTRSSNDVANPLMLPQTLFTFSNRPSVMALNPLAALVINPENVPHARDRPSASKFMIASARNPSGSLMKATISVNAFLTPSHAAPAASWIEGAPLLLEPGLARVDQAFDLVHDPVEGVHCRVLDDAGSRLDPPRYWDRTDSL